MILERNENALDRPQRRQARDYDQRQPESRVDPERRLIEHLDDECRKDDDESGNKHGEERRAVGRIGEGIIETAALASWLKREKSVEQPPLSATRTAPAQAAF